MNNSSLTFSASDWRLADRFAGFTLIDASADWYRGEWLTVSVALLGLRLTFTRWLVVPVESLGGDCDCEMEHEFTNAIRGAVLVKDPITGEIRLSHAFQHRYKDWGREKAP